MTDAARAKSEVRFMGVVLCLGVGHPLHWSGNLNAGFKRLIFEMFSFI